VRAWAAGLSLVIVCTAPPFLRAQGNDTARIYAVVTDKGGKPIKGLTAADFAVTEDGAGKRVLTAEPAAGPLSIALLVDRFGQDATFNILAVRGALDTLVKTLHAHADTEMSLTTIDPAAVPQIPFTMSAAAIGDYIKHLPPGVDQSVLLEGIMTASRSMSAAKYPRRAIVALVAGYKVEASAVEGPALADALRQSRSSLWVLEGRSSFGAGSPSPARDAMLTLAVPASGGAKASVGVGTALGTQAKRLAELLMSQYEVTYAAPSTSATELAVSVNVKNAKVMAPVWIAR
jgi:hypothetical protein